VGLLGNPAGSLTDGRKTVTAAGTAVPLTATSTPANEVAITALSTNTGVVVVGGSTVKAKAEERRGQPLSAGQTVSLDIRDLSSVYIDSTVSGEGVSWMAGAA